MADWALVAPRAENGTVSKISNQIIFSQCVVGFCGSCSMLFFDLGRVEKQLEWRALRCISGLVRTGKSDDDADIDRVLLIAALATGDELESSVHLLWLAQETSEKNTPTQCSSPTSPAQATADARSIQAQRW